MKLSDKNITSARHTAATLLLWCLPLLLLVHCIALDITEVRYTAAERAVNILVPGGAYLLLLALWRRNGLTALCLIPVMVLCAFQIVLLFLYGESIIAVDMFLNVTTTNAHEAGELLRNLTGAIAVVLVMYVPAIVVAAIAIARKSTLGSANRRAGLAIGSAMLVAGIVVALGTPAYKPQRVLFPVNVTANIFTAGERTKASDAYLASSEAYRYGSRSTHPDSLPEVYVLVIGETSRADNWQLNGYSRPTNPRLSQRSGLVSYTKAMSESNTTHKSVPLLMTQLGCEDFADSIYTSRSVIDAFDEAGYTTAWISNQQHNGSLIDFFGSRADSTTFLADDGADHYDLELCSHLRKAITDAAGQKLFVVLHTYGSHFNYKERYPAEFNRFTPDDSSQASPENRQGLINAYDNAILYTDAVLDSIIGTLAEARCPASLVYLADHGEDIYDDSRERFLHASPTPTYWQLHVPMLVWMSNSYREAYPEKYAQACNHADCNVASSRSAFHTLMSLAGINTGVYKPCDALTEASFAEPQRMYLNDYNEGLPLADSGLREPDFEQMAAKGIF